MPATFSKSQAPGIGAVISIGGRTGATGTEAFLVVGECSDATLPDLTRAVQKVTNFASPNGVDQYLDTTADPGKFSFTCNRISNDPGQMAVLAAGVSGGTWDFKVQIPVNAEIGQTTIGDLITFPGIVTSSGGFAISITQQAAFKFEVQLNGESTVVSGS